MSHRFPVSWSNFYRDAKAMAWRLKGQGPWEGIIAITRGGLVPASLVAHELNIRKIDTISIASYGEDEAQGELRVLKESAVTGDGEGWLVIDDLADSGDTAVVVRRLLPKAHIAVVYAKPDGVPTVDSYMTEVSQDTWIIFPWEEEI